MGRTQDFTNSIIYHIRHMESKEVVYVGSTTNFYQRKAKHKHNCNHEERKDFTIPIYCHIRDNGGFGCFEVIPIKSLKLENKTELLIAEQEELDKHQTLVNRNKAHITIEEQKKYQKQYLKQYREEFKEELKQNKKQHDKKYREANKAEINEKAKNYREANKEQIKEKRKKYLEANKEQIKEQRKKYLEKINELNEKYKQKIECKFCSKQLTKGSMYKHIKTCKSKPKEEK